MRPYLVEYDNTTENKNLSLNQIFFNKTHPTSLKKGGAKF